MDFGFATSMYAYESSERNTNESFLAALYTLASGLGTVRSTYVNYLGHYEMVRYVYLMR